MRDPERISRIIDKFETYWKKDPDLRLGQLIFNLNWASTTSIDPFYTEDDVLEKKLDEWLGEI